MGFIDALKTAFEFIVLHIVTGGRGGDNELCYFTRMSCFIVIPSARVESETQITPLLVPIPTGLKIFFL